MLIALGRDGVGTTVDSICQRNRNGSVAGSTLIVWSSYCWLRMFRRRQSSPGCAVSSLHVGGAWLIMFIVPDLAVFPWGIQTGSDAQILGHIITSFSR